MCKRSRLTSGEVAVASFGVHRDKQNSKPELPIKRIPQRGGSRNLVEIVAHRRCSKLKLELHR